MDSVFFLSLIVWSLASFARRNIYYFYGNYSSQQRVLGKHIMPASGACFSTPGNTSVHAMLDLLQIVYVGAVVFAIMAGVMAATQALF